ncbi:ankyrin repeat and death domain-containing protein 1A isoform X1 [Lingula anatina]|uniref:Ankyrin repeat and death domain-containing protein 1A isoform X1 n=1 Tax=Lingula anatina TaxID=7574 RepID=A0A1S3JGM8_LINAN|nr:ankyrin repeat and death domain-containing protein 1A isoform X1 [Lingula anatina]|eukprot:XP_013409552.1 ankyrin repeat and death domain-containing protein 1A isoform X1 [Lingula anatina]
MFSRVSNILPDALSPTSTDVDSGLGSQRTSSPADGPSVRSLGSMEPKLDMSASRVKKLPPDDVGMVTVLQVTDMLENERILHEAARINNVEKVKALLQEQTSVNARNNLDRTPLHVAASSGHQEVAEVLICAGADVEAKDKYGMRAILWAAWFGHSTVMRLLVNAGANTRCASKQGLTVLHCAAQNNKADIVKFIVESLENFNVNEVEKDGRTALHLAAEKGHLTVVDKLIESKGDVHIKDKNGQTALHLAALGGHLEVVKKILLVGANINDRDYDGLMPLHCAASNGHSDVVEHLLKSDALVNAETNKQMTALHLATVGGHEKAVAMILQSHCNVDTQNQQGNTALHLACLGNHSGIANLLIDAESELNLPNARLQTPLHVAVENGLADVAEVLLAAGADLNPKEKVGKTALYLAAAGSFVTIVDMLIKADRYDEKVGKRKKASKHTTLVPNGDATNHKKNSIVSTATKDSTASTLPSRTSPCTPAKDSLSVVDSGNVMDDKTVSTPVTSRSNVPSIADVTQNNNEETDFLLKKNKDMTKLQFKVPCHVLAEKMKPILWKLASKQLKPGEWKRLALYWNFSEMHIKSIEHQYTGQSSYKTHGYRMLLIWLHGVPAGDHPIRLLYEALAAVGKKDLAETIRKTSLQDDREKTCRQCSIS